jgi:hypothetical protein
VSHLKYLGTTERNQNLIQEEIKRRLKSGNACYHSDLNVLSSRLLSKYIKIRICKTIILSWIMYWCDICSLTLREECRRLRVFRTEFSGEYLERSEMTGNEVRENCIMRKSINFYLREK